MIDTSNNNGAKKLKMPGFYKWHERYFDSLIPVPTVPMKYNHAGFLFFWNTADHGVLF